VTPFSRASTVPASSNRSDKSIPTTESLSSANDTLIPPPPHPSSSTRPKRVTPHLSRYRSTFALRQYSKTGVVVLGSEPHGAVRPNGFVVDGSHVGPQCMSFSDYTCSCWQDPARRARWTMAQAVHREPRGREVRGTTLLTPELTWGESVRSRLTQADRLRQGYGESAEATCEGGSLRAPSGAGSTQVSAGVR